jgi:hypothetical protein
MPSRAQRILFAVFAAATSLALLACSGDNPTPPVSTAPIQPPQDGSATVAPEPTDAPEPTPTLSRQGPTGDGPTGPGPLPGGPCPVEQDICDFARRLLPLVEQGNAGAILALTEPVASTCPVTPIGFGGPSVELCAGAAPGTVVRGYWDVQAGEGLVVTEAEWRRTLTRWFAGIRTAQGSDAYGPGQLRIGAISCARNRSEPSGRCGSEMVRIHFTFINSPSLDPSQGTGLPGQRVSFHFTAHRGAAGELRLEGSGTVVPPNTVLLAFENDAVDASGRQFIVQYYPWTP